MTCGGCDLSVAHENCILTLASVAQINKMSKCFYTAADLRLKVLLISEFDSLH